jgi:hypothetical protein
MLKPVGGWLRASVLLLFALAFAIDSAGQDFNSAANQLVSRVSPRVTPSAASLIVRNRSSLNDSSVSLIRADLQRELQSRGWKLKKAEEAEALITVTLSENVTSYVWTAEITQGQGPKEVAVFELPRPNENPESINGSILLSRTLLVSSDTPLLDVALLEGKVAEGAHLLALAPNSVQLYRVQSSQAHLDQTQPLNLDPIPSRDLRGRIVPGQGNSFDAFLPGLHCTGVVSATLTVSCRQSDDPWPFSDDGQVLAFYAPHRNYFNGVVRGTSGAMENNAPFYSAAVMGDRLVYAGLDGHSRSTAAGRRLAPGSQSWGSNVSGIQSSCSSDLLLGTSISDFNAEDSITAFRLSGPDFVAASEAISFSGPIVDLKTSLDHQQAVAVVASLSGRYEAYLLTARCGA